ncbi:hypothetical protein FAZ19_00025 [Sphingobacterium alkalisoli]|uniref:Uncharacterized protein n=1 Tax=Sphingobacterium alkalisoli TaxID=1874115 RepID=A0A4U0H7K6_9SPHI|nr:hypothetical protein [Sphingobacterium alkalisoli]TJY67688.1 hypothetical protein FAZ19_00025 [Sphingobacterium alkalisoli]GGH11970.1 hypothetical protein GCM10011418_11210 [Sphingobacterium alkalisoli]
MENKDLQVHYQILWEKYLLLGEEALTREEQVARLTAFNSEINSFSSLVHQFMEEMTDQIVSRMGLQNAISDATINDSAFASFYSDQINFYRTWLNNFEQIIDKSANKCTIGLTVRQLLLLLRLAKDMELLPEPQLKPYLRFLQLNVRTPVQEALSYESLRKKYSEFELTTIRQIRQLLERMLRRLNHYQATHTNK